MTDSRSTISSNMVNVCHRLSAHGMVAATDGNVSVRLPRGNVLVTRSGINKGMVTENDIVEVSHSGDHVSGHGKVSTEIGMHLFIYEQRPDVMAVVHAHPVYATGFATAGKPLDECIFPEVIVGLGAVPLAGYATPSTAELASSLSPFVKNADAILLANHGVVTYGSDVWDAYFKMEKVEHAAHIVFVASMLGGAKMLTAENVEKLRRISVERYGKDFSGKVACETGPGEHTDLAEEETRRYVAARLRELGLA